MHSVYSSGQRLAIRRLLHMLVYISEHNVKVKANMHQAVVCTEARNRVMKLTICVNREEIPTPIQKRFYAECIRTKTNNTLEMI